MFNVYEELSIAAGGIGLTGGVLGGAILNSADVATSLGFLSLGIWLAALYAYMRAEV